MTAILAPVADPPAGPAADTARTRRVGAAVLVIVAAGAVALPWLVNAYLIALASYAVVLALLALSAQLLAGGAGLPSMGQAAYLGVGAYTAALFARQVSTNGPLQLAVAAIAAAIVAAVVGVVAVRTRGTGYLMLSIAVAELVHVTAVKATAWTGGSDGVHTPPVTLWPGRAPLSLDGHRYLYLLGWFTAITTGLVWLGRTRFTLILRAVAEHEPRAVGCGHHPAGYLWTAHTIAGALAGTAGALLVAANSYAAPTDLGFDVSTLALVAAAIARRSKAAAVAIAVVLVAVRDLAGGAVSGSGPVLLGGLFIATAYLPRRRITALTHRLRRRWTR